MAFYQTVEMCELENTMSWDILLAFVDKIVLDFVEEYLRSPTEADRKCILSINESRGF